MVIKISALIYTLASIALITLMIMRPVVEVSPNQVQTQPATPPIESTDNGSNAGDI